MKHSTAYGPELMVQLAIAHLSPSRHGYYPKVTAKHEDIAAAARLSVSRTRAVLTSLVKHGRLFVVDKPHGQTPGTYELPIRGSLKADTQGSLDSGTLIREKPNTQTSRAEFQDDRTTEILRKIIEYPKPPKRKKA